MNVFLNVRQDVVHCRVSKSVQFNFVILCNKYIIQVECKKAQPKEVMLPANLAKTRTPGRGTYGEFLVLNNPHGPSSSLGAVGTTLRYTPYPLPTTMTTHHHASAAAGSTTTHLLPMAGPSIVQLGPGSALVEATPANLGISNATYKRVFATTAAAANSLRHPRHPLYDNSPHHNSPHHHHHHSARTTATLTYPLGDLLQVQGLDIPALFHSLPTTIGL